MANQEHLDLLLSGVEKWNAWREENPDIYPDLTAAPLSLLNLTLANFSNTDLTGSNFEGVNLAYADLTGADLKKANLQRVNFIGTKFLGANLEGADLTGAWMANANNLNLSGAIIDSNYENIRNDQFKGFLRGINGIYNPLNKSLALSEQIPAANSMQGNNPDAVIESLKRARHFFGSSLGMVAIVVLLSLSGDSTQNFEIYKVEIKQSLVKLVAMSISLGALVLCASFLSDGLKGARYIKTQEGAMKVGNFPWMISKYSGSGIWKLDYVKIIRIIMIFHPLAYISIIWQNSGNGLIYSPIDWAWVLLYLVLISTSFLIFRLSQKFQYPILFDPVAEKNRKSDVEKQTEVLKEILDRLTPKEDTSTDEPKV